MAHLKPPASKDVVITYVKGEGILLKFWGLPVSSLDIVKRFEAQFAKARFDLEQTNGFLNNSQTPVGFKGAVYSKFKLQWCRARVLQVLGYAELLVQLLDYGNEEIVSVADIRNLDDSYFRLPPQALECILADVIPAYSTEWSPDALRFCEQQLLMQTVTCCVVSQYVRRINDVIEKVPIVRIAKQGEVDPFVQRLINSGLAHIKSEGSHHQVPQQQQLPIQPTVGYKMNKLDPNTTHLIKVVFIESAQKFFVQLAAAELELKKLMDEIAIYSASETMTLLNAAMTNTPCLAQLPNNRSVYYRAMVIGVNKGLCTVLFVDYGCSETINFHELRALPNRFLTLQAQAICCSLKHGDTNSESCFRFGRKQLLNCHVLGYDGDAFVVRLAPYGTENITPMVPRQPIREMTPPPVVYRRQTLDVNKIYEATVSYINDVTEFYCQLTTYKDHLNAISSHLNSGAEFEPIPLSECQPNVPVCVKFSEDHVWYRAQVIKVNHEADIEVFFVDFGNFDNATLRDVRRLKPEFMALPVQAYKCCLFEVESPSDSTMRDNMFDMFEELTTDQVLRARIQSVTDGQCYVVTLQEPNSATSINEKIQAKFSTISTVTVSEVEQLFVTCVTSSDMFFAQFEKMSSDKLTQMQEELNASYFGQRNTSYKPNVGNYVCAKFQMDGMYYRARVEAIRGSECEVLFIDYGNRDSISLQDVHPLQKQFMANPQFGVECGLEDCPPATPFEKLKGLLLENSIQARMIKEQNKKWIVALTEHKSNVAILELLRQHETLIPRSIHGAGLKGYQDNVPQREHTTGMTGRDGQFNSVTNENLTRKDTHLSNQSFDVISIPAKAFRNVFVCYVISPGEFYVQLEEESQKFETLKKSIEDSYTNNNEGGLSIARLSRDMPCCATYEDGVWYRGQVKEVGPSESSVYFIDYGNTDLVSNSNIKVLLREFFSLPPQALRCKSYNVFPVNGAWSESEIDTFSEMTLEKSFVAQFVESDAGGVYAVNLISPNKLQEEALNKEFLSLVKGTSEVAPQSARLEVTPHSNRSESTSHYNRQESTQPIKPKQISHVAAPSNVTLQPSRVQVGSREAVTVYYGINPGEIFCQLKSSERDFNEMMIKLQSYYNKVPATDAMISHPHPKMICVAQFFQDLAWYRAEVKSVERNAITVCYVDYGNCETVNKEKVCSITEEFATLPRQAIKCRLKGLRPPGQTWVLNQNISKYYEGESECHFIEKDGDCFIVDIVCNNKNVAQQLVKDGLAASIEPTNISVGDKKQYQTLVQQSIPKRKTDYVSGQLLSIIVSYVDSPYKFWCQLLDEAESLEQLMADIEVQYMESENLPIDAANLKVGSYCMAKYSSDDAWYRAQIKSCMSTGEYEVFFIDYGNSEVTTSNQLAAIVDAFLSLPPQCFECRLHKSPSTCGTKTVEEFQKMANEVEEWTAKVENVDNDVCVLTLLYEKEGEEVNVSDTLFGEAVPLEAPRFPTPDIPLGPHDGYVTEVTTPHDFFIQLASVEDALTNLSTDLSAECEETASSGKEQILSSPTVGCACSAKYAEDNNWYRAEVIAIQETTVDVLFVDYGNVNSVPKDSLRVLSPNFLQFPPYAIKCKLNGIIPNGDHWQDNAIDHFRETVSDSLLSITFISKDVPATVNICKEDKEIAQGMVDLELAVVETCPEEAYVDDHLTAVEDQLHSLPLDFSYPKRKLTSTKLPVKICYVESYSKFYCMPLELSTELDTVMKTLEILYSPNEERPADMSVLEDPSPTMACVAKYSEDETWYRATITEMEEGNISVMFVDYGNSETTTLENLRPLTPELIKIPPIAIECNLHALRAVEGKEQEITAKLEELSFEEVPLEMEIVQAHVPYSIRLYHEGDLAEFFTKEGLTTVVTPLSENVDDTLVESLNENVKENLQTAFVELSEDTKSVIPLQANSLAGDLLVNVKFSEIENDTLVLYAVPVDLEDDLAQFQDNMQSTYNQLEERLSNVNCLDFCVAKSAEDELWYRAQVASIDAGEIIVKYIDYGNSEIVAINSISKLLPEFASKPQFAVKFCLSGCKVRQDKSGELQGKIDELLYNEPLTVNICKYSHSLPATCIVDLICGESSIVDSLLNEKLLLHQFTVNSQLSEKFEATVENIVDSIFYVLPLQFKAERDKLQARLLEVCDASASAIEIDPGRLYAAKVEESWSRVAISDTTTDSALVKCLDYGLDVELQLSKLVLLPEELCHHPLLLQPCLVANLEDAPDAVKSQDVERLAGCVFQFEVLDTCPMQLPLEVKISEKGLTSDLPSATIAEDDIEIAEDGIEIGKELNDEINDIRPQSPAQEFITEDDTGKLVEQVATESTFTLETDTDVVTDNTLKLSGIDVDDLRLSLTQDTHVDSDEIKILDGSVKKLKATQEISVLEDNTGISRKELSVDTLKSIEDALSEYSDMVSDIEKKSHIDGETIDELISSISIPKLDEENYLSTEEVMPNVVECKLETNLNDEVYASEDHTEEPIVKESAYICGEEATDSVISSTDALAEDERNRDSEFEEFQSDEAVEESSSSTDGIKKMEVDELSDSNESLDKAAASNEDVYECIGENIPENALSNNVKLVERISRPNSKKPSDTIEAEMAFENGFSDGKNPIGNCFGFSELNVNDSEMPEVTGGTFAEADIVEEGSESQEPESEAVNYLPTSQDEKEDIDRPQFSKVGGYDDEIEEEANCFPESDDKLTSQGNIESAESDVIKCQNNTESAEVNVLENINNVFPVEDMKTKDCEDIQETKDDAEGIEDPVESSNLNESPKDSIVEDNEWDERPECDIKPDSTTTGALGDQDQTKNLLSGLIGTPWHNTNGRLKAIVSKIDVLNGSVVVCVQPSPEELGSVLFNTFRNVYSEIEQDFDDPSVSNLCAVNFADDWFRAKVVEVEEDTLKVSLIDMDTTETVLRSAVRDLKVEHKAPLTSVLCSLASVHCPSVSSTTTKDFLNSLRDTSKETFIELVATTDSSNIKINLLFDGHNVVPKLLERKLALQKISPLQIKPGKHNAKVSHLSMPSELYINLVSELDGLHNLKSSMQSAAYPSGEVPVVESNAYAVQHNDVWVRVEAVSLKDKLLLRLVDTGEIIPAVQKVYSLLPEHCLHPPYAIPCKIPADIPLEALSNINDFTTSEFEVETDSSSVAVSIVDESLVKKIQSLAELETKET